MNANPSTNFDQARKAVSSGASMQSSFVAVPGASSSVPSPSMNFPAAPFAPPLPDASAVQPTPPIPDASMQASVLPGTSMLDPSAAVAPTLDVNTTPFSSATTPPLPPPPELTPLPAPLPPAPKAKPFFAKKWSLSRKVAVALMATLAVVAVAIFFYSYFSRRSVPASRPSGSTAMSPTEPKDFTIHLAQGSVLELQGLKDLVPQNPGADLTGLKKDLATMQKTLESIDSNQKMLETSLEGWDDWQPKDWEPSSRTDKKMRSKGAPASAAPTSAPASAAPTSAPASPLAKTVRYSADLAMQTADADRDGEKSTNSRWASGAPTRFYGEAHSSPMHFSTFPSSVPQSVHV